MSFSVLVVDDSPILRMAIRKAATLAGADPASIREAANGREALDRLAQGVPDVVLLDLNMPVMTGDEFAAQALADPRYSGLAVVVVSTECNQDRLAKLRACGVMDILPKPFEPEVLARLVKRIKGVHA